MHTKRCFFIGSRDTSEMIYPALHAEVERHITALGVTEFLVGHYGRFDHLAAKAVISAKQNHSCITLFLLLPYHPAEQKIELPEYFDGTYYPPGMEHIPRKFAITRANRYAVEHSDYLIACAANPTGNAQKVVEYARRREKSGKILVSLLLPG